VQPGPVPLMFDALGTYLPALAALNIALLCVTAALGKKQIVWKPRRPHRRRRWRQTFWRR
jgi:hypothetical protein